MLEDGTPRELKSFRLVEDTPAAAGLAASGAGGRVEQPDPLRRVTLVSLVFDHLTQNGRQKEIGITTGHVPARLQIAFELVRRGEAAAARPFAEDAVTRAPTLFAARLALGQVRLELGDVDGAITQLERAVALAPRSPQTHFMLARAYARARDARPTPTAPAPSSRGSINASAPNARARSPSGGYRQRGRHRQGLAGPVGVGRNFRSCQLGPPRRRRNRN